MVFGRLLPREGNFFELFNQHGQHIALGARAFMAMVQNYADRTLREKYAAEVDGAGFFLGLAAEAVLRCGAALRFAGGGL